MLWRHSSICSTYRIVIHRPDVMYNLFAIAEVSLALAETRNTGRLVQQAYVGVLDPNHHRCPSLPTTVPQLTHFRPGWLPFLIQLPCHHLGESRPLIEQPACNPTRPLISDTDPLCPGLQQNTVSDLHMSPLTHVT